MTQRISRSTAIFLMIITAYVTYYFHADITEVLMWTDQTIIQPYATLWTNLILALGIGSVCFMAGWGFWIFYEEWLRKNAEKLVYWVCFWTGIFCGTWVLLMGVIWGSLVVWLCAYAVLMILADMETKRR